MKSSYNKIINTRLDNPIIPNVSVVEVQYGYQMIDKNKLIQYLYDEGHLKQLSAVKIEKSYDTRGRCGCCYCSFCNRHHDDCVCEHNNWVEILDKLTIKFI